MSQQESVNPKAISEVAVKAAIIVDKSSATLDDLETEGVYIIKFNQPLDPKVAFEAALDVLHAKISISDLEAFEFTVMNMDGNILKPGDSEHDSYSMSDDGDIYQQLEHNEWDDMLFNQYAKNKPGI